MNKQIFYFVISLTILTSLGLFPAMLRAENSNEMTARSTTEKLIEQCHRVRLSGGDLTEIVEKVWQLSEISYGLRYAAENCLNHYFENEVIYTWDQGWQFVIRDDQLQAYPRSVIKLIDEARRTCSESDEGILKIPASAIQKIDLTGNGINDQIFSYGKLHCTSESTLWCGSGGCTVALIVNDEATEFLARGYRIVYPFGNLPIILFDVHGTECGGSGATNCILATVWGDKKFEHTKNSN